MWTKETQSETRDTSPSQESRFPAAPLNTAVSVRASSPTARALACLGSTIKVKGEITSGEDLQIDGDVEGSISLKGHRLTVGRTAQLNSEITASELIIYGKTVGNLLVSDRVEIKRDGELIGDITTSRISIEEGAYFKGRIEIERAKSSAQKHWDMVEAPVGSAAN